MAAELTPMMRQYMALKREVPPGAIVMFRLGDFYEMFGEDAVVASPILGATLTHRGDQVMCGIPHHALNSYLAKLIRAGKTAALCDQVEDPKTAKGLVRREITRIVTPGTVTEDGLIDENSNNYVASVYGNAMALLDLSTGEFLVEDFPSEEKLAEAIEIRNPAEMLRPDENNSWTFAYDAAFELLTRHFKVVALDGFGLQGKAEIVCAAGALLYYVGTTLHHAIDHVRRVSLVHKGDSLAIDGGTIRHLQLLPTGGLSRDVTLLGVLDVTKTPMGSRTMRNWISRPPARAVEVNRRLDAVEAFVKDRSVLSTLRAALSGVRDLERLIAKANAGRATPRDVVALSGSLRAIPAIREGALAVGGPLAAIAADLTAEDDIVDLIGRSIVAEPPALMSDGGFIGFDFILRIADELYPVPLGVREDPRRRFVAVSTDLHTGKPFYAEYGVHSPFRKAIKASASLAFSSRIVKMRGKELLDGGYSAAFPLEWAEENGYRKKIAILTQPIEARKEPVDRKKKKLFAACYSSYPAFLQTVEKVPAMYNAQREKLASMAERGQAFVIAPRAEIPLGKMESNTQKLYLYYLHGRRDALQALDALKEYLKP